MQGRVFYIVRPGEHDDFGHPNAVILQLGPDSYLCVAGFTPGKHKYQQAKDAEHKQGIWGTAFAVEIDHAKHLTPIVSNLDLHLCGYICQTAEQMTATQLNGGQEWGQLSGVGVKAIASGLLERQQLRAFLTRKAVVELKKLLGQ